MGGLIARYAASAPGPGGARDRSGVISRIVTLGTPNTGSVLAAIAGGVVDTVPGKEAAVIRLLLSGCGAWTTQDMDASVCSIVPFVGAFQGDAGRALRAGSPELTALPKVPTSIPVDALAGSTRFTVPRLGWFEWSWSTDEVPVGDVVVTESSAESGASEKRDIACRYQLNPIRGTTDQLGLRLEVIGRNEVAAAPLGAGSGPCFHLSLMRAQELANEVAGVVNEDIADRYVSREDLLTAPVPALRGTPAGTLVNGELDAPPGAFVKLERTGGAGPALGDLNGDGRGDAAAVMLASVGAGGGGHYVFAYTKRNGRLVRVGEFDPATATSYSYNPLVTGMVIKDGVIDVTWQTYVSGVEMGPMYAATVRLQGKRLVASNVHEVDGATADALPVYPETDAAGIALADFLRARHLDIVTTPIDTGCEHLVVYGADLAAGNVDLVHAQSLCDGDAVQDFYRIRGGRVVAHGEVVLEIPMGDMDAWRAFVKPYGRRSPAAYDIEPGDLSYYLTPYRR